LYLLRARTQASTRASERGAQLNERESRAPLRQGIWNGNFLSEWLQKLQVKLGLYQISLFFFVAACYKVQPMNPEELKALAEKAKQVAAEGERLRREQEVLIKKIVAFSKEEERKRKLPTASLGALANRISPAFQYRNQPPSQSASP
jgi:hypothetical protein